MPRDTLRCMACMVTTGRAEALNARAGLPRGAALAHPGGMRKAVLLAMLLGCDTGEDSGPCAERAGLYQQEMVAEWGDCPSPIKQVVNVDGAPMGGKCTGSVIPSADNCSITQDQACTLDDGAKVTMVGKTEWSRDGASGTGKLSISLTPAFGPGCSGLYRMSLRRL